MCCTPGHMSFGSNYRPDPRITSLGPDFYDEVEVAEFPRAQLRFRNPRWAKRIGLDGLDDEAWCRAFGRFEPLPGNLQRPLALRYHGHQFRSYNPNLGDGRGFLFAQLRDDAHRLLDLGTKGTGTTPWSRGGDGRLTLKGGVREVLATEMLEAIGVHTSKTLSLCETGESLQRNDEPSPTRSSVLVRLSHSHVRFGTFQRFAYYRDRAAIDRLVEYCVTWLWPDLVVQPEPAIALFERVVEATADLCASYMLAGFVHGVLNTDNMSMTGESFDYGPYRFLPRYDPGFVAAYFDEVGLYAYGRQPHAMHWNLLQLAQSLARDSDRQRYETALTGFEPALRRGMRRHTAARLGVSPRGDAIDDELVVTLFEFLDAVPDAFGAVFFDWYGGSRSAARAQAGPRATWYEHGAFAPLRAQLEHYETADGVDLDTPYFAADTPCDLVIDEIEGIWAAIAERDDWGPFQRKLEAIDLMRSALNKGA